MPEPTLYLFDGYNLLHAGDFADARELVDLLASFVALHGARGVVVFDGVGEERDASARSRCASRRTRTRCSSGSPPSTASAERSVLVSSDAAVRGTAGQEVGKLSSQTFLRELDAPSAQRAAAVARSRTGSTRRRAPASSASAAASKLLNDRDHCKELVNRVAVLAIFPST